MDLMKANKKFYSTIGIFTIGGLFLWSINDPKVMSYFDKKEESEEKGPLPSANPDSNEDTSDQNRYTSETNTDTSDQNRYTSDHHEDLNTAPAPNTVPVPAPVPAPALASNTAPSNPYAAPALAPNTVPSDPYAAPAPNTVPSPYAVPAPAPNTPPSDPYAIPAPATAQESTLPSDTLPQAPTSPQPAPVNSQSGLKMGGTRRQATANKTRRCKHCNHEYQTE